MPKFEEAGVVYGPDVNKPTVEDLEKEGVDVKIKNRPDGNMVIATEKPSDDTEKKDKENMEETLKKHGVDSIQ
ncbi:MAG: hypothetical protein WC788_04880 [Candidatus Paceibacterota bacterium]|jgi:hypothetical protein